MTRWRNGRSRVRPFFRRFQGIAVMRPNVTLLGTFRTVLWTILVLCSAVVIDVFAAAVEAPGSPALGRIPALSASFAQRVGYTERGLASVYSEARNGHVTASGQIYDKAKLTAAHKTLPYGTKVNVRNPDNNKSVILLVNDRGPVPRGRILDISPAAASRLGFHARGVHEVTLEVVEFGSGQIATSAHH